MQTPQSLQVDLKTLNYDFTGILFWEKITGFFSLPEAVALQCVVKQLSPNSTVVELGAFQGRSSIAIASVLPPGSTLHSIDNFQGALLKPGEARPPMPEVIRRNKEAFLHNTTAFGVNDKVQLHVMNTTAAASLFADESVDLIFIDAGHKYDDVKADITHYYPKLKPGGYMLFDDYEEKWPGVMQAVQNASLAGELIAPSLWCHRKSN